MAQPDSHDLVAASSGRSPVWSGEQNGYFKSSCPFTFEDGHWAPWWAELCKKDGGSDPRVAV